MKPDNILLEEATGRALVTDFGIAHTLDAAGDTPAGDILGTTEYMSPEQAGGEPLDGRSDLYALGGTAFFALTGQLPVPVEYRRRLPAPAPPCRRHLSASIRPGLPPSLAAVVDRCLAKLPAERFPTAEVAGRCARTGGRAPSGGARCRAADT